MKFFTPALIFYGVAFLILIHSCSAYRKPISQRPLPPTDSDVKMNVIARPAPQPSTPPELYTKSVSSKVIHDQSVDDSGSLMRLDDDRNYFFTKRTTFEPGQKFKIVIASNRVESPKATTQNPQPNSSQGLPNGDDFENELLKSFPNLEPGEKGKPPLIRDFNVTVTHQLPNGDVLVAMHRESKRNEYANSIEIRSRIPLSKINQGGEISTKDLMDIEWNETFDGEFVQRKSPQWEDEYTLRLSGFEEAKSRAALALQDQRKQLQEIRDKLDTRIKSVSKERQDVAKLRSDLNKKAKENEEKIETVKNELENKEKELAEAKKEIEELKQEKEESKLKLSESENKSKSNKGTPQKQEKSGDKKDGSYGKK